MNRYFNIFKAKGFVSFEQERGLDNKPHATTSALEEHSENTVSSVLYLILECLGNHIFYCSVIIHYM